MFKSLINFLTPPADPNKSITPIGIQVIRTYEGLGPNVDKENGKIVRCRPYICPAGKPTIGYGRVVSWTEYYKLKNTGITIAQAEENLKVDVTRFSRQVAGLIKVFTQDWQFDSCVSLAYNVGIANFKSSTLLRKLNAKDYAGAANEFPKWVYANKKKLPGLVNRREAEKRMFLNNPPRPVLVSNNVKSILAKKDYMELLVNE